MILVISSYITNRLSYVLDFIQECYPNLDINLLKPEQVEHIDKECIVIEYGEKKQQAESIFIPSCGLLRTEGIKPINKTWNKEKNVPEFLINSSEWGYDIFAYIFFQLSRYEEYIPTPLDSLGRFKSENSIQVQNKNELAPAVDLAIKGFLTFLKAKKKSLDIRPKKGTFTATLDIDIAYDYLGRSIMRTIGAFAKNLFKPKNLLERITVLLRIKKDPAFIFERLKGKEICYFVHVGDNGPLDKSCGLSKKDFQAFLQNTPSKHIGLHPSFQSHLNLDELLFEMEQLETISDQSISQSRQHFIKMIMPDTYELLLQIGVQKDYSMGWPDRPGYRSGTVHSHFFFNLRTNEQTDLFLYPFCWMDAHFIFGNTNQDLEHSFDLFKQQHMEFGGDFRPIFHNNHFKNNPQLWELVKNT